MTLDELERIDSAARAARADTGTAASLIAGAVLLLVQQLRAQEVARQAELDLEHVGRVIASLV